MKNPKSFEQESNVEFYKKLIKKFIKNWYLIIISLSIALAIGHFIYKSTPPIFRNNLIMLMANENSNNYQGSGDLMQFEMFDIQSSLEDELGIIRSFPIINKTIRQLDLSVSYYIGEGLIIKDIYKNNPFVVISEPNSTVPVDLLFKVQVLSNNRFSLSAKSKDEIYLYNLVQNKNEGTISNIDFSKEYSFGDEINIKNSKFKILLNGNFNPESLKGKDLFFKFNNIEQLTYQYQSALTIERVSNQSSLITLEIKTPNSKLTTDFLNTLAKVYLEQNLEKKNKIATKTIEFIENQISEVADSLVVTAGNLESFRREHKVMDIDYLSQNVYTQLTQLQIQKSELILKSKYYDYIKEYFENNKDLSDLLAPSSMGVDDPQLVSLITQLTELNARRSLYLDNKSLKNPEIPDLNAKITNIKRTILENINYIVTTSDITINDIDNRIAQLNKQISKLPTTEKELINIRRKFDLNDAIYTFLLQKRSEAEIARASNSPDYEVIDPAKLSSARQVAPKKQMIYFSSFFLGLMLPIGFILLLSSVNENITERRDIEKATDLPILASIAKNDSKSMTPVADYPKSLIAETFRSLRTSLQFFRKDNEKHKFLVTSTYSGEGKTFISINLAIAYSYFGKKTLLIEFDLRNPKVAEYFGLNNSQGLSSYLTNDASLDEIIQNSGVKNLDVITSGALPPNPVELMASENTKSLMEILEAIYDFIIIDSPPIGVVTDPYLLINYSDINIFTVRMNHTNKKLFTALMDDIEQKEIQNFSIVINDEEDLLQSSYYDKGIIDKSFFAKKWITFKKLIKRN
ncbi:MAG: polysaccharide biosynthesis tyrosine autokinase [Bacteroidales bacterium]|nr:polysaccharide biosynthesis tyrosine autokinase [Bacteroidales bacterium]